MKQCPVCFLNVEDDVKKCEVCGFEFPVLEQETMLETSENQSDINLQQGIVYATQAEAQQLLDTAQMQEQQEGVNAEQKEQQEVVSQNDNELEETQLEDVQTESSNEGQAIQEAEFECSKCKKILQKRTDSCECGGYAISAIKSCTYWDTKSGIGFFGWGAALILSLPTFIVSALVYGKKKKPRIKELRNISLMCTIVYACVIILYLVMALLRDIY